MINMNSTRWLTSQTPPDANCTRFLPTKTLLLPMAVLSSGVSYQNISHYIKKSARNTTYLILYALHALVNRQADVSSFAWDILQISFQQRPIKLRFDFELDWSSVCLGLAIEKYSRQSDILLRVAKTTAFSKLWFREVVCRYAKRQGWSTKSNYSG